MFPENTKVYVLHVDEPKYLERKQHIIKTMAAHDIPFEWMLKGNMNDITPDILEQLFSPAFATSPTPLVSCGYKHYLAWKDFLNSAYDYCLIFEDDVFLADDFVDQFKLSLQELSRFDNKISIQYSNAANQYTPKSRLIKGQCLYPNKGCRATDSYLMTKETARLRCEYVETNQFSLPADGQTNVMDNELGIQFLWFEPTIVEQGTQSGRFKSMIQVPRHSLWFTRMQWQVKKYFRQRA